MRRAKENMKTEKNETEYLSYDLGSAHENRNRANQPQDLDFYLSIMLGFVSVSTEYLQPICEGKLSKKISELVCF